MKVTHVISNLGPGGAEASLFRLVRALPQDEFQQDVISLTRGGIYAARLRALGTQVLELDLDQGFGSALRIHPLLESLRGYRPDIVQGWMYHGNTLATFGRALAARGARVCWNIRQTSASLSDDKFLTRALILGGVPLSQFCSRIIYNSTQSAEQHEGYGYGLAKRAIIHNGIDCEEYRPNAAAREGLGRLIKLPPDAVVVGRFGRKAAMKDHRNMLRAFGLLAAKDSRCRLVAIGQGMSGYDPELMGWAAETGAAERVHFLNNYPELQKLMPAFDINVSSSSHSEGFPNVVAEGMACGVPTVATDVGESRLIVGDPARIVPAGDAEALAASVGRLIALPSEQRRSIGLGDRARISDQFSISKMVAGYASTWRTCLG